MRYSPLTAVAIGWACLSLQMVKTGTADDKRAGGPRLKTSGRPCLG